MDAFYIVLLVACGVVTGVLVHALEHLGKRP